MATKSKYTHNHPRHKRFVEAARNDRMQTPSLSGPSHQFACARIALDLQESLDCVGVYPGQFQATYPDERAVLDLNPARAFTAGFVSVVTQPMTLDQMKHFERFYVTMPFVDHAACMRVKLQDNTMPESPPFWAILIRVMSKNPSARDAHMVDQFPVYAALWWALWEKEQNARVHEAAA